MLIYSQLIKILSSCVVGISLVSINCFHIHNPFTFNKSPFESSGFIFPQFLPTMTCLCLKIKQLNDQD